MEVLSLALRLSFAAAAALAAAFLAGCEAYPAPPKEIDAGSPPIVYSPESNVSVPGGSGNADLDVRKPESVHHMLVAMDVVKPDQFIPGRQVTGEELLLAHKPDYLKTVSNPAVMSEVLRNPEIKKAPANFFVEMFFTKPFRFQTGSTIVAAQVALKRGWAYNLGGGFHHATADKGDFYCVFNDVAVAIRRLQKDKEIEKALVIDMGIHQGNGTALIFAGDNSVYTYSIFYDPLFPTPKAKSTLDRPLDGFVTGEEYLGYLASDLDRIFASFKPDIVFVVGAVNVWNEDPRNVDPKDPKLKIDMSEAQIVLRDLIVFETCRRRQIPVVFVTGGGSTKASCKIHAASIRAMIEMEKRGLVPVPKKPNAESSDAAANPNAPAPKPAGESRRK